MTVRGPTDFPAAPRIARAILALRVPMAEREFVKGDLAEGYAAERELNGEWRARVWYARQLASILRAPWGAEPPTPHSTTHTRESGMRSLFADTRLAMRGLRRAPLFSMLVILTLTIGIGATTAVFSVVYPVVLAAPPYPNADRIVTIYERERDGSRSRVGFFTGVDIARDVKSVEALAMKGAWQPTMRTDAGVRPVPGVLVSHNYFAILGVRPAIGRDFTAAEDHPGTRRVVMLSDAIWRTQFGGDSTVIARGATINGVAYAVAGVMPPGFRDELSPQAEVWSPLGYDASLAWTCRTCRHLRAVALLKRGVTHEAATQDIDAYIRALREKYPDQYASVGAVVPTLRADIAGPVQAPLLGIFGAVALLLALACANVANLFLGRTGERQRDLAIRLALGAGRARLVCLVALDAVLLAMIGGALGIATAWIGTRALLGVMSVPAQIADRVAMSPTIVGLALVAIALSAIVGGALPAMIALGESALAGIRAGSRAGISRARHRVRNALVVCEVAIAVMLLAGAGLQVRSLERALSVDTGFDATGVVTLPITLTGARYKHAGTARAYYRQVMDAARSAPSIATLGVVSQLPLAGNFDGWGVHREDKPSPNPERDPGAQRFAISKNYLDVMHISVLRGRGFTSTDREGSEPVMLVNKSSASRIFGTDDPIGKRIRFGGSDGAWRTIVGIVADVRHLSLESAVENQMYLPFDQNPFEETGLTFVARANGPTSPAALQLVDLAKRFDPDVALAPVQDMNDVIGAVVAPRRLAIALIGGFSIIALILALGGLYGVMAAGVAERAREMGLRAALGATPLGLVRMVMQRGALLTAIGVVIGVAGFVSVRGLVSRFVFGVSVADPVTLAGVAVVLAVVAMIACALPGARAARTDPVEVLRG